MKLYEKYLGEVIKRSEVIDKKYNNFTKDFNKLSKLYKIEIMDDGGVNVYKKNGKLAGAWHSFDDFLDTGLEGT